MTPTDLDARAARILDALDRQMPLEPFSGVSLREAYAIVSQMRRLRTARGETPVGRKIGFTNRTIWEEYQVFAPMWGYMYDTTLQVLPPAASEGDAVRVDLSRFAEPRLEPEIAFRFGRAPEAGMSAEEILACVDHVGHGIEIVQSHYPGWRFAAADTVATNGLHGAYHLGPLVAIEGEREAWLDRLATFEVALWRDGVLADVGQAANVLGGPLLALSHLLDLLRDDPENGPVEAGEIITTGTVTKAFPVQPGETWHTEVRGLALPGLTISFH